MTAKLQKTKFYHHGNKSIIIPLKLVNIPKYPKITLK